MWIACACTAAVYAVVCVFGRSEVKHMHLCMCRNTQCTAVSPAIVAYYRKQSPVVLCLVIVLTCVCVRACSFGWATIEEPEAVCIDATDTAAVSSCRC